MILFLFILVLLCSICIIMNIREMGLLIKKRRDVLQISQQTLSEVSGIAVHTLSNIEAGKGNPTVDTLNRVLDVLGMELRVDVKQ